MATLREICQKGAATFTPESIGVQPVLVKVGGSELPANGGSALKLLCPRTGPLESDTAAGWPMRWGWLPRVPRGVSHASDNRIAASAKSDLKRNGPFLFGASPGNGMTLAGLEPAIFGSEDQRLIH